MTISHQIIYIRIITFLLAVFVISLPTAFGNIESIKSTKSHIAGRHILWALSHPFIAVKVKKLTKRVMYVTDSLENAGVLTDRSGGQLDAFKHSFWMAILAQNISLRKARRLGIIHEKVNYSQFKRHKANQDSTASLMDLKNNEVGILIGKANPNFTEKTLISVIIEAVKSGQMFIIKKDSDGNYLNCKGDVIQNINEWKWDKGKCLVASSKIL